MNARKRHWVRVAAGSAIALALSGAGCLSMQSQTSLDATNAKPVASNQPYVEVYVEYAGPQQKWAGPSSFILHVMAKDAGPAQIVMTPTLLPTDSKRPPELAPNRNPASYGTRLMTSEEARAQLAHMAD